MQAYTYIFLHRIWNEDERIMNSVLDYGEKVNHQTQVIFIYHFLQIFELLNVS